MATKNEIYEGKMKTMRTWLIHKKITGKQFYQAKMKLMEQYLDKKTLEQMVREEFTIIE